MNFFRSVLLMAPIGLISAIGVISRAANFCRAETPLTRGAIVFSQISSQAVFRAIDLSLVLTIDRLELTFRLHSRYPKQGDRRTFRGRREAAEQTYKREPFEYEPVKLLVRVGTETRSFFSYLNVLQGEILRFRPTVHPEFGLYSSHNGKQISYR